MEEEGKKGDSRKGPGRPRKGEGKGKGGIRKGSGAPSKGGEQSQTAQASARNEYERKRRATERDQYSPALPREERYPKR